jgi:copper chaperone CopZ
MANEHRRVKIAIDGMHCDGCVRRVRSLIEMAGAEEVHTVAIGSAEFTLPAEGADAAAVTASLNDAGFSAAVKT